MNLDRGLSGQYHEGACKGCGFIQQPEVDRFRGYLLLPSRPFAGVFCMAGLVHAMCIVCEGNSPGLPLALGMQLKPKAALGWQMVCLVECRIWCHLLSH